MRYYNDSIDPLVSLDLTDVLEQAFQAAEIHLVNDLSDLSVATVEGRPAVLISARSMEDLRGHTEVSKLIANGGGVVVLNDADSNDAGAGNQWAIVMRPYDDAALIAGIRQVTPKEA